MSERNSFAKLRNALAYLYTDKNSAIRIAYQAGLNTEQISFSDKAVDNWHSILLQAEKERKTAGLMAVTFQEFRENEILSKSWHDYLINWENDKTPGQVDNENEQQPIEPPNTRLHLGKLITLVAILVVVGVILLELLLRQFFGFPVLPVVSVDTSVPPTPTIISTLTSLMVPTNTLIGASASTSTQITDARTPVLSTYTLSISTNTSVLTNTSLLQSNTSIPSVTTQESPTPIPINNYLLWVNEYVRLSDNVSITWQACPSEPLNFCVTWNMYTDNQGIPVSAEILKCKQNGSWINDSRIENTGLDVGKYAKISGMTIRNSCPQTDSAPVSGLHLCGDSAFNKNLQTQDPQFLRPEGYLSGWISSDPSTVILSNGMKKVFSTQYVLIVEDLSDIQLQGVQRSAGKANSWGCWYSADLSSFIMTDAKEDFCKKKANNNVAVLYRVSSLGFEELYTTSTVSCP